jgi:hypothetical protein
VRLLVARPHEIDEADHQPRHDEHTGQDRDGAGADRAAEQQPCDEPDRGRGELGEERERQCEHGAHPEATGHGSTARSGSICSNACSNRAPR